MTPFHPRRRARLLHVSADVHAFFDAWQKWAHEQGRPWAPLSSFVDAAVRMTDAFRMWKATGMVPGQETDEEQEGTVDNG